MSFRYFLAQILYKRKSIIALYFSRLRLQQNCGLGAQAADHNQPKLLILLCTHTALRGHADMKRSRLCPQVAVLLSHKPPQGKGQHKQFPELCSSGMETEPC